MASQDGASFEWHLGRFLLLAYAAGARVEGTWVLLDADQMVPDVEVVVEQADAPGDDQRSGERSAVTSTGAADFKERLQTFVLERFSEGGDIEGVWRVRFGRPDLPAWDVRIASDADNELDRDGDGPLPFEEDR